MNLASSIQFDPKNHLNANKLTVVRDEWPLFDAVSFTVKAGEALQISGSNGAGKTSLLRCLCGLSQRFEGEIWWNGRPIGDSQSDFFSSALYIGHGLGLKSKLSVRRNLSFYQQLNNKSADLEFESVLAELGIAAYIDEPVGNLSAGQKRRVSLARLLSEPSSLWVLDEPLVALDIQGQEWLERVCNKHLDNNGLIVMTSHQPVSGLDSLSTLELIPTNRLSRLTMTDLED